MGSALGLVLAAVPGLTVVIVPPGTSGSGVVTVPVVGAGVGVSESTGVVVGVAGIGVGAATGVSVLQKQGT